MSIVYKDIWGHYLEFIGFEIVPSVLNKFHPDCLKFEVRGQLKNECDFVCVDDKVVDTRLIDIFSCYDDSVLLLERLNILLNVSVGKGCCYVN